MNKNMFLLWGEGLATTLHDRDLHADLRDAGAQRLQVDVDDEAVAAALRIPHFDRPVQAVVSTWGADPAPAAAVLARTGTVHGYAVDERRRLDRRNRGTDRGRTR